MEMIEGRNGGKIKRREKGDPPEPGSGRPKGSKSFKTLFAEALERTTKDKDGKEIPLKELSALQIVGILLSRETDDNTKLKAFSLIQATLGEAPATKNEVSGPDGTPLFGISKAKQEDIDKLLDLMDGK
jgi:hypothetical protein